MSAPRRPRVLLLHGFLSGKDAWRSVRRDLAPRADTIALDLPGYGSAPPVDSSGAYSIDEIVRYLEPVVRANEPTHVVGHSMGGIVALALASRFPGPFESVGVIGLPVFRDRADGLACLQARGPVVGALLQKDHLTHAACVAMRHTWPAWLPLAPLFLPGRPRHAVRYLFHHDALSHAASLDHLVFGGLVETLAAEVRTPVAALHGGRDRSAPIERVREVATLHGWDLRTAPTQGHQLPIVRPQLSAKWIQRYVVGLEAEGDAAVSRTLQRGAPTASAAITTASARPGIA